MQVQSSLKRVLDLADVFFIVLDLLSLNQLRVCGLICKASRDVVKGYFRKYYNTSRVLRDFLPMEHLNIFTNVQRTTGTLIGGSVALQFLTRQKYARSDLDLYVHYLFAGDLMKGLRSMGCKESPPLPESAAAQFTPTNDALAQYAIRGIAKVWDFDSPTGRKIQVVVTCRRPVETIFSFHSTTVMNFITSDYAYALYGKETLEDGLALYTRRYPGDIIHVRRKYEGRGWVTVRHKADAMAHSMVFKEGHRVVGDNLTWIVKLSTDDGGGSKDAFIRDAGWKLSYTAAGDPRVIVT